MRDDGGSAVTVCDCSIVRTPPLNGATGHNHCDTGCQLHLLKPSGIMEERVLLLVPTARWRKTAWDARANGRPGFFHIYAKRPIRMPSDSPRPHATKTHHSCYRGLSWFLSARWWCCSVGVR
jgi:hypothetical protein